MDYEAGATLLEDTAAAAGDNVAAADNNATAEGEGEGEGEGNEWAVLGEDTLEGFPRTGGPRE